MVFEKNEKKIFFRKIGLPAKPKYPEISETFFSDSFPKIKFSTSLYKKIKKLIGCILHVLKLIFCFEKSH